MRRTAAEKLELVRLAEGSDLSVRHTLRELGVARSTFYAWHQRYRADGRGGLAPPGYRRRAPPYSTGRPRSAKAPTSTLATQVVNGMCSVASVSLVA